jgi:hypothetical protein
MDFVTGQGLEVHGKFLQDSVKIGEDATYYLTVKYPSELNILFPDSTFAYMPFEFHNRKYFPTKTNYGLSYDSVIYHLRTFETDPLQHISLPIYVVHPSDCTVVYASADSISLQALIRTLPDSISLQDLPLKRTVAFERIPTSFNYIILALVLGILIVMSGIGWMLFGKKIRRHYRIRKLQKNHNRFIEDFSSNLETLNRQPTIPVAESAAILWKSYLENLESKPYTKLTTREILKLVQNDQIRESLRSIDRTIYGNHSVSPQSFENLKAFAEDEFRKKMEEVMHE